MGVSVEPARSTQLSDAPPPTHVRTVDWPAVIRTAAVFAVVGVVWLIFALLSPYFLTLDNIRAIFVDSSNIAIIATGLTVVIIAGEIDLSIGAVQAMTGSIAAVIIIQQGVPWVAGVLIAVACGGAIGLINGLLTTRLYLPSFVVTLAMLGVAQGLAFFATQNTPISEFPGGYLALGTSRVYGVPTATIIALVVLVVVHLMLHRTTAGRHIFAVGGNPRAAVLAGINVERVKANTLVLSGTCAGIGGVLLSSRLNAGAGNFGSGDLLPAVAAVVIGGTSLAGGLGSVWGTAAGVVLLASISDGLIVINVQDYYQQIAVGLIIIGAMLLNSVMQRGTGLRWIGSLPARLRAGANLELEAAPEKEG